MRTRSPRSVAMALLATMATGCAPIEPLQRVDCAAGQYMGYTARELFPAAPRLDCAFGDAVNMAIARQTLDPNAAVRNAGKDAAGMDGSAARDAIYNYQKSFRSPEPASNAFTINIGGGQTSGGQ